MVYDVVSSVKRIGDGYLKANACRYRRGKLLMLCKLCHAMLCRYAHRMEGLVDKGV